MADIVLNNSPNNYTAPPGSSDRIFGLDGSDTLRAGDANDTLIGGGGDDVLVGGQGNDVFDGTALPGQNDLDFIVYYLETGTRGVVVNLATGTGTDTFGNTDTYIAIEAVRGTSLADTLVGGNVGNDDFELFSGMAGNDTINGGTGFDEAAYDRDADFAGGLRGVTVNLVTGVAIDGFGNTDRLTSIESVRGTRFADTLIGGNALSDNAENFSGLAGNDTIIGGTGYDEVRYDRDAGYGGGRGVIVNLNTGNAVDGFGNADRLTGVEAIRGTALADRFIGKAYTTGDGEYFYGLAGNDTIEGGGSNLDFNEVRYDRDAQYGGRLGVTVNFATGVATDGFGNTDTLVGINSARGTQFADRLTGGNAAFSQTGEFFLGFAGNDTIDGGANTGFNEVRYLRDAQFGGAAGVNVNLAAGFAIDGFGNTDTLLNINSAVGTASADRMTGGNAANDSFGEFFEGLRGNDTIDGGSGYDEIRYQRDVVEGGTRGVVVNLLTGRVTDGFGTIDTVSNIEGAQGTRFADVLRGNDNNTRRFDTLSGLEGNDTLNGGLGNDEVRYDRDARQGGGGAVTVNLAAGTATDGFGNTDTLLNIEAARGTAFADRLTGGASANSAYEGFNGLEGNDTLSGGAGFDEVRYLNDAGRGGTAGIVANLALGTVVDGFGNTDTVSGIEAVVGTQSADRMTGDALNNRFQGLGGNDTIDGGAGTDTVAFNLDDLSGGTRGVIVNLNTGNVVDAFGSADRLTSIEFVIGSVLNDLVIGNGVANSLVGDAGNDTLNGGLAGDVLTGGLGNDVYQFTTALGATNVDTIGGFAHGADKIALSRTLFAGIGTTLDAAEFGSAADPNNFIIYNQSTGQLFYDAGGSAGGAAPVLFARVAAGTVLDVNDFTMI